MHLSLQEASLVRIKQGKCQVIKKREQFNADVSGITHKHKRYPHATRARSASACLATSRLSSATSTRAAAANGDAACHGLRNAGALHAPAVHSGSSNGAVAIHAAAACDAAASPVASADVATDYLSIRPASSWCSVLPEPSVNIYLS